MDIPGYFYSGCLSAADVLSVRKFGSRKRGISLERRVNPGEFYRHFKNKLYQVVAVAVHSETGEPMVVYQALYGDYKIYVRPYDLFVSEVDHEKYPQSPQKYRFEKVVPSVEDGMAEPGTGFAGRRSGEGRKKKEIHWKPGMDPERQLCPNPVLLQFLDAETYEERMEYLQRLSENVRQSDLDSIYVVLDMKPLAGTAEEQIAGIRHCLTMQHHYDGSRLR